jgi:hypothetical protein
VGRCAFALCIRRCCQQFFQWYNTEHRHAGIALMTPHTVHHGHAVEFTQRRVVTLTAAFAALLTRGEMFVVHRGVEHKPYAEREVKLLLIEPRGVLNTGHEGGDRTAENDVWI